MMHQDDLFPSREEHAPPAQRMSLERLSTYDRIVVAFSGGKDSLATLLHLLELGVERERIELWHHHVDGAPGGERFMDWPVTESYCRKVAEALAVPILFQWKEGGFLREMLRDNEPTAPTTIELRDGRRLTVGGAGPSGTRLKFPQVTADLTRRWCSAYLKIDVARKAFANDPRFARGSFLLVTGERREESAARARYAELEQHCSTTKARQVDQWRAIIDFTKDQVWDLIERFRINPHPAYRLGFGRVSCMACIVGDADQWATVRDLAPDVFARIAALEERFGVTIDRKANVTAKAGRGLSIVDQADPALRALSQATLFDQPAVLAQWSRPRGAGRSCSGPT
jgi:3'-phosphoadenosine 5'-phosphosulfate sulfotransferase (PAPS reductase)/FAD synthetase